jgi:2-C-methyl-D-erythritol 2,4-cyclodiphosphate synthase
LTLVAQKPKLSPYVPEMRGRIAQCLGLPPEAVSVKATTTERLGFAGREEGIAAHAVCTIESNNRS